MHRPPLALADLPPIDAVLISHEHYDHLDMGTIEALGARGVTFHVPLGVGAHLAAWGIPAAQIVEHDWWQEATIAGGVRIVSTPARHFNGRGIPWRVGALWTSWSIVGPRHRLFFSGDTGLTEGFSEVARREGPFDVAMLEIGQYHESWGTIHLGPVGALEAFARLGAKTLIPIHWGTFVLAYHAWSEPAETLLDEAEKRGVTVLTPRWASRSSRSRPAVPRHHRRPRRPGGASCRRSRRSVLEADDPASPGREPVSPPAWSAIERPDEVAGSEIARSPSHRRRGIRSRCVCPGDHRRGDRAGGARAAAPQPPEPAPEKITLGDAVSRALGRNPSVAVALSEIDRADALIKQARSGWYPTLNGYASYTRLDHDRVFNGVRELSANEVAANLTLTVPLVSAPAWINTRLAKDNRRIAEASASDVRGRWRRRRRAPI